MEAPFSLWKTYGPAHEILYLVPVGQIDFALAVFTVRSIGGM